MKIAISAKGQGLDAQVDSRFGRSHYFVVVDTETGTTLTLTNDNATAPGGAGIQTAQLIANQDAGVVITGRVGPKAAQVLDQAGIQVHSTRAGTVREALQELEGTMGVKNPSSESVSSSQVATGPKRNSDYKVAIATEGNLVAAHFGHCSDFTIVTVKNSQIEAKEVVPNPGHRPGFLPRYLADLGIDCIIAGGMGGSAQELFTERGIMTIIGVQGPVDDIVAAYVAGNLQVGESLCDHDGETSC